MSNAFVDRLEARVCFATGVVVTSELLVGSDQAITALTIGFSGPLDPASARDVKNYFFAGSRGEGRRVHDVPLAAASYEEGATSVTLTTTKPFPVTRFKRLKVELRVDRAGGLAGADGVPVDGDRDGTAGGDSLIRFKISRGTSLKYKDADGDRVTLRVRGAGGRPMTTLIGQNHNVHEVWVSGTNNGLVGSVKKAKLGDGIATVGRVVLEDASNHSDLTGLPFSVGQTVIDGQAGVDPLVRTL
ncbi:MAG: Calx-beta protein [Phycisphaerales bacterium]|nr:Calx-beta protein [Phycisphaerales bacterium]